jgi:hypothetical protein
LLDLYYIIKPFIPRTLQVEVRSRIVRGKRSRYKEVWPINEMAGRPPKDWSGWPEDKKFALVLTHDVEGAKGVKKCSQLAKIDRDRGFRSCFNFVPESCKNTKSLHRELYTNGFEVGVHGLCHDGNLFSSRRKFVKMAEGINHYLKEWRSVGFRTPSMYHNMNWLGELPIEYDSSTFDTDPFEPQPDGMGTIFPFWVTTKIVPSSVLDLQSYEPTATSHELPATRNSQLATNLSSGYVELPYTLPQDFTLFVLMREKTIDIWKRKLDWIVEKGGMALLITHPDYMKFEKGKCGVEEYTLRLYEEMLDYIREKYEGQYWNVLPKEMARFWKDRMVSQCFKKDKS